jgi:hypothetical protein
MHTLEQLRTGKLAGVTRLKLACNLTEFPTEIFELADSLEILDLSGNALSALPADLPRLHQLRVIFCSDNQFTELPAVLGQCQKLRMIGFKANQIARVAPGALPGTLRWLVLTDNQLQSVPEDIGACDALQKLMLAGNQLQTLPDGLANCTRLELVRIAANQLKQFPHVLLGLPRISWLAFAGNPFCEPQEAAALTRTQAVDIAWDQLRLEQVLGEGASGVIHRARLIDASGIQPVAVKIFKGEITSDGLPHCEMAACLGAGTHAHLIPVFGQVHSHPQGANGLVMALVDSGYVSLAGPPSLESCTRDIYGVHAEFDIPSALGIALAMARVGAHLHALGMVHGDLYGHNILHNHKGHALLGDFGAASFYSRTDPLQADSLQRIEVRAFGCLLQELRERCPAMVAFPVMAAALTKLCERCLATDKSVRPLFREIEQLLLTWTVPAAPGTAPD